MRRCGWPVLWGVLAFLLVQYASGLWRLAARSGGMDSKFSQLAVEEHRGFLIGQNLLVLVAYAILAAAAWLLVVPLVATVCRRGRRWLAVLLAFVGCVVLHGYFMFRLVHSRPYFTGDSEFGDWYYRVLDLPPESWQPVLNGAVFEVLPWVGLAGVAVWWWSRFGRKGRIILPAVLLLGGLAAGGLPSGEATGGQAAGDERPPLNVIVIGSDSLRGDLLGFAGHRPARADGEAAAGVSPHIDRWAEEASVFLECRTPIASTLEAGIGLMSSTYPHTHGIRQMFPNREQVGALDGRIDTLAGLVKDEGYDTAAIGDWCAGYYEVTPLGFDEVEVSSFDSFRIYMSQAVFLAHFVVPLYFDNALGYELFPQIRSFAQFVTPEVVTRRIEEKLVEQAATGRPFLWHVFYSCNHLPYRSEEPYCGMFADPDYRGPNKTGVDFDIDAFIGGTDLEEKWSALGEEEVAQIRALYDGCTRQFDECFRRILDALERTGLAEHTIVVLTADHGDDLYEPGVTLGHGLGFNGSDRSYHVPLAIRLPGGRGGRFDEQVRTLDLAPTLAGLLGLERPASWEGVPLDGWMDGREEPRGLPYYGETQFPFILFRVKGVERPKLPPMDGLTRIDPDFNYQFVLRDEYRQPLVDAKQRCLRTGDWKLVCTPAADGSRHFALFHTVSDPDCRRDLAKDRPEVLSPMREALERWMDERVETPVGRIFPDGEPR